MGGRRRKPSGNGRAAKPPGGAAVAEVVVEPVKYPAPAEVPDWSERTAALLERLLPLERCFVEWYSTGCNAAESYRQATGAMEMESAKVQGHRMRLRPHVKDAIDAVLTDRNFGARMDREFQMRRLQASLERAEKIATAEGATTQDQTNVAKIVRTIAELKGELVQKQEVVVKNDDTPAMKRFLAAVDAARQAAGVVVARPPQPVTG